MLSRDERGQSSAEYLGIILVVAVLIGAIAAFGIGGSIADGVRNAICSIVGQCEGGDAATARELEAREDGLADLSGRGATYARLLDEARAARERGDLDEADRILDRLELYKRLVVAERGELVDGLVSGSEADYDALVAQGTIEGDASNRRYFRVAPSPGDGIIAMDYFIPGDKSIFLKGDDRGTADPLLGQYGLDRSRIVVVIDRESGRGMIYQSRTCTVSAPVIGAHCENPRPIELRQPRTRPQINPLPGPQAPNEFGLDADGSSIALDYDALNSITPIGISVDGHVRLELGDDGYYKVTEDSRDKYPRIVTSQYPPGKRGKIIDETHDEGVIVGAPPPLVRPSCDNPILSPIPILC